MTIRAAGILFVAPNNTALFLKRGPGGDCPGMWCCPGGKTEDGEDAMATAIRETLEEAGYEAKADQLRYHTRSCTNTEVAAPLAGAGLPPTDAMVIPGEQVDFVTFLCRVPEQFTPTLCPEHTGYAWAPVSEPPEPLHPGVRIALDRLTMNELGVARAMAAGQLYGPQKYENVMLWNMRITGTGVSYRSALDEFVLRDPDHYMNEDFLARSNGLPVIWEHPEKPTLTSKEFAKRVIGTVFMPYLRPEAVEVWAITKIFDDEANQAMLDEKLSTSPAVVFRGAGINQKMTLENGEALLIEGDPTLLDHLAVCEAGVWDKGGPATGIEVADAAVARHDAQGAPRRPILDADKLSRLDQDLKLLGVRLSNHRARHRALTHLPRRARWPRKTTK